MDSTMNYVKFRYDFRDDDEHPYQILPMLFNGNPNPPGIMGIETQNARGTTIKRHLHYHFMTNENVETIRKRFTRAYPDRQKRGRGWYSLEHEKDVKDIEHFFRYPIKQIEPCNFDYKWDRIPIPEGFDIKYQNALAYEEWAKGKEILTKKENQRDSRLSVYEKILDIIQNTSPNLFSLRDCKIWTLEYFIENEIPPNKNKISDIANGIALKLKLISKEEFLDI